MSTLYLDLQSSIAYLRATKNASTTILSSFQNKPVKKLYPPFNSEIVNNLSIFTIIKDPLQRYVSSLTQLYIEEGHTTYNLLSYYGLEYTESIFYLISLVNSNITIFPIYDNFNLGLEVNSFYKNNFSSWYLENPSSKHNHADKKVKSLREEIYKHIIEIPLDCHHLFYSLSKDYFIYYKTLKKYNLSNKYDAVIKCLELDKKDINKLIYKKNKEKDFKNIFVLYSALNIKNELEMIEPIVINKLLTT